MATGTLAANGDTLGPVTISRDATGSFSIAITGTITVTLKRCIDGASWVSVEAGYTASTTKHVTAPGQYKLEASGVSGGSATCALVEHKYPN